jgi:hypothetical protein
VRQHSGAVKPRKKFIWQVLRLDDNQAVVPLGEPANNSERRKKPGVFRFLIGTCIVDGASPNAAFGSYGGFGEHAYESRLAR